LTEAFMAAVASTDKISAEEILRWLSTVRAEHVASLHAVMGGLSGAASAILAQIEAENAPAIALMTARIESALR
jgi:hypothetical protein